MKRAILNFADAPLGPGLPPFLQSNVGGWEVVPDPQAPGGRSLRLVIPTHGFRLWLTDESDYSEVVWRFGSHYESTLPALVLRWSTAGTFKDSYYLYDKEVGRVRKAGPGVFRSWPWGGVRLGGAQDSSTLFGYRAGKIYAGSIPDGSYDFVAPDEGAPFPLGRTGLVSRQNVNLQTIGAGEELRIYEIRTALDGFETAPTIAGLDLPKRPEIQVSMAGRTMRLGSTVFADPLGKAPGEYRWQIHQAAYYPTLATGMFSGLRTDQLGPLVFDSDWVEPSSELVVEGLGIGAYFARVTHRNSDGIESPPSLLGVGWVSEDANRVEEGHPTLALIGSSFVAQQTVLRGDILFHGIPKNLAIGIRYGQGINEVFGHYVFMFSPQRWAQPDVNGTVKMFVTATGVVPASAIVVYGPPKNVDGVESAGSITVELSSYSDTRDILYEIPVDRGIWPGDVYQWIDAAPLGRPSISLRGTSPLQLDVSTAAAGMVEKRVKIWQTSTVPPTEIYSSGWTPGIELFEIDLTSLMPPGGAAIAVQLRRADGVRTDWSRVLAFVLTGTGDTQVAPTQPPSTPKPPPPDTSGTNPAAPPPPPYIEPTDPDDPPVTDAKVGGSSIFRRPDAVTVDFQTSFSVGPDALGDVSKGIMARVWRVRHVLTETGGEFWISRSSRDNLETLAGHEADWEPATFLFDYEGEPCREIDLAFEQLGQPVVCAERHTGAGGSPRVWLYWFDPQQASGDGAFIFEDVATGRSPRALLDQPEDTATSDVQVFYARAGTIYHVQQRDRYEVEIITPVVDQGQIYVEEVARSADNRVIVIYSKRNAVEGTYTLHWLIGVMGPIHAQEEHFNTSLSAIEMDLLKIFDWIVEEAVEHFVPELSVAGLSLGTPLILYEFEEQFIPVLTVASIALMEPVIQVTPDPENFHPSLAAVSLGLVAVVIRPSTELEHFQPTLTAASMALEVP